MSNANPTSHGRRALRLEHVRVADVMHAGVVACAPATPLREAARTMVEHRIHCLVVSDRAGAGVPAWSIVSDLDIIAAATAGGIETRTAGEIAASDALTISDDDVLQRAVQVMTEHQAAHLVVVGAASGRPSASSPPSTWPACWPGTTTADRCRDR